MSQPLDMAKAAGVKPTENPWTQPPLRKLANEIHDNATQMMILGQLILAHGDLLEKHHRLLSEAVEATRESTAAMRELAQTLKDTLE